MGNRSALLDEAFALYNRLAKLATDNDQPNERAVWANELAHDAIVRYLRRAGHPQYQGVYRAFDIRYSPSHRDARQAR